MFSVFLISLYSCAISSCCFLACWFASVIIWFRCSASVMSFPIFFMCSVNLFCSSSSLFLAISDAIPFVACPICSMSIISFSRTLLSVYVMMSAICGLTKANGGSMSFLILESMSFMRLVSALLFGSFLSRSIVFDNSETSCLCSASVLILASNVVSIFLALAVKFESSELAVFISSSVSALILCASLLLLFRARGLFYCLPQLRAVRLVLFCLF